IRSSTTTKRDALAVGLERMLHAACTAAGATGEFIYEPMYPATVNHASEAIRARAALERVYGPGKQVAAGVPIMGSEDFSYYLEKKPGAYILLGTGRDGRREPCHSPRFDFDDRLIPIVVRLWADLAGLG
ncbi:MAG: M20/M25/M40 family metallo-hydrolase, partial [Planctomycetota bacterium]